MKFIHYYFNMKTINTKKGNQVEDLLDDDYETTQLKEIADFFEYSSLFKVINKLTDYAEIITEGKLSGLVNFNYNLNSTQTSKIIEFLVEKNIISNIKNLALKGSSDLENEFVSNIISETTNPETISSYVNLRTLLENRLTHQTQQYNVNMAKNNSTQAMPINELRGHSRTVIDLKNSNVTISHKAHHGMIAASLHDSYITIINRSDWWEDRSYQKFFFNEDDSQKREFYILSKKKRKSLTEIQADIKKILLKFSEIKALKTKSKKHDNKENIEKKSETKQSSINLSFTDKMLHTPFGQSYGLQIDKILNEIFKHNIEEYDKSEIERSIDSQIYTYFELFKNNRQYFIHDNNNKNFALEITPKLLLINNGIKTFSEKFLHKNKLESFTKFYSNKNKNEIEDFIHTIFIIYFENEFVSIFKIIRSKNLKQFACAYIMKRIYLMQSENITTFGYYFIQAIAKLGSIKT